ncbi:hypothetical protein [Anaplasma phagocytophilum]|nr:hypothetical protein [Anaplasma phagocytophilum]
MIGSFFLNGVILSLSWREVIVVYIGGVVLDALRWVCSLTSKLTSKR